METRDIFAGKFPGVGLPTKSSTQDLVRKWHTTGSVTNAKKNRAPSVRTPDVIADIQARMIRSPTKSTRKLSQQTNVSRRSCQRVLQFLQMKPYRMTCVQELKQEDKAKRAYYCTWLLHTTVSGLWPPRSPHLSTCDFYLWDYLKGKVYANNPKKLEDLKENIRTKIRRTDNAESHRVYDNMLQRAQKCIDVQGDHFQHLF